ncbi:MAG: Rieske (2Fe-2S) protein [Gemmataceae bacterium]|nr:Rieske (2Fe-2S) protein [Gemmataceae bacterium]
MTPLNVMPTTPAAVGQRVAVCRQWDIPLGLGRSFEVAGRLIGVFKARDGLVFAVAGTCPHKGGPLADGMVVGHQVVCPLHAFRFEARTGTCDQPGVCGIAAYPVEVTGDTVYVIVPSA